MFVFEFGRDQMETIVDRCFAFGLLVPVVDAFDQRLTFVLHSEVDDAGGPAVSSSDCASAKVVGRLCATERKFHVRVWIDTTRNDELVCRVDHCVGFHFEFGADN